MKQVIVVRNDLKMPKGKLAAQVAHASMMFLCHFAHLEDTETPFGILLTETGWKWFLESGMCKVVLCADSLEQIEQIHKAATEAGLTAHVVRDAARTTFREPTVTCLAIGPAPVEEVDAITGGLRLL